MNSTASFSLCEKAKPLRSAEAVYSKRLLVYTFFYTAAFAAGCLVFHMLDAGSSARLNAQILRYFSFDLGECSTFFDVCDYLLSSCSQELSHLFLIFTAGFTLFATLAISLLLVYRGFALGFSVSYLTFSVRYGLVALEKPQLAVVVYTLLCAMIAAVLIHFGVRSSLFSEEFKALCGNPKRIAASKALYLHLFRFLTGAGAILLLNLLRCVL